MKINEWRRSPLKHKKYRVILSDGTHRDFGDKRYLHYQDNSPLKLYSHLDHLDKERRRRYHLRHSKDYEASSPDMLAKNTFGKAVGFGVLTQAVGAVLTEASSGLSKAITWMS